jgi:hypothetical protein
MGEDAGPYRERHDPLAERLTVDRAAARQRDVLPGLSDDRLRVVRARLLADGEDPVTLARLTVVHEELARRERER